MEYFKDFLYVQKESISKTFKSIDKVVYLLIPIMLSAIAEKLIVFLMVLLNSGFISGFAHYIVRGTFYSYILAVSEDIVYGRKIRLKDFTKDFRSYLSDVFTVMFIMALVDIIVSRLTFNYQASLAMGLLINLTFSAAYETIYVGKVSGYDVVPAAINFMMENPLNWILPNLLAGIVSILVFSKGLFSLVFNFSAIETIPLSILAALLVAIFKIYKGHLYKILDGTSLRKREYERRNNG